MTNTNSIENQIAAHLTSESSRKYLTNTICVMREMKETLTYVGIAKRAQMNKIWLGSRAKPSDVLGYADVFQACHKALADGNATHTGPRVADESRAGIIDDVNTLRKGNEPG